MARIGRNSPNQITTSVNRRSSFNQHENNSWMKEYEAELGKCMDSYNSSNGNSETVHEVHDELAPNHGSANLNESNTAPAVIQDYTAMMEWPDAVVNGGQEVALTSIGNLFEAQETFNWKLTPEFWAEGEDIMDAFVFDNFDIVEGGLSPQ